MQDPLAGRTAGGRQALPGWVRPLDWQPQAGLVSRSWELQLGGTQGAGETRQALSWQQRAGTTGIPRRMGSGLLVLVSGCRGSACASPGATLRAGGPERFASCQSTGLPGCVIPAQSLVDGKSVASAPSPGRSPTRRLARLPQAPHAVLCSTAPRAGLLCVAPLAFPARPGRGPAPQPGSLTSPARSSPK